ncbi:MAG: hypothetical protein L0922_02290, partial [Candidatus Mariimomonas ferrooxydans]
MAEKRDSRSELEFSRIDRRVAPAGQVYPPLAAPKATRAGMTTGKDDKGFLSFPLVGNHSLEIYNPLFTEWLHRYYSCSIKSF